MASQRRPKGALLVLRGRFAPPSQNNDEFLSRYEKWTYHEVGMVPPDMVYAIVHMNVRH